MTFLRTWPSLHIFYQEKESYPHSRGGLVAIIALLSGLTPLPSFAATTIPFTVNMSEPVNVTGCPGNCPRIVLDVGGTGTPKYANYSSGSGTSTLTFTYTAQEGDIDLDGITITSNAIDLNTSGTIKDLSGNDLSPATFTIPNTTGIKVDYPSLAMDFINSDYLLSGTHYATLPLFLSNAGGTFTRASTATYFDAAGTLQTAASGAPRFDYDPVTHVAKGIFIEETKTNYLTYSDQINNAAWTTSGLGVSVNSIAAPDGTLSAEKIIPDAGTGWHYFSKGYAFGSATYTASLYMKMAENRYGVVSFNNIGAAVFDLQTGTVSSGSGASITSVGNGWYRCVQTVTTTGSTTQIEFSGLPTSTWNSFTGNATSGIYVWGAQLETGNFPTSYIPTTAAAVTRQADDFRIPTGPWHNAAASTLVGNGASNGVSTGSASTLADIDNNNWSQRFQIRLAGVPPTSYGGIITDTAVQASLTGAGYTLGNYAKVGMAATLNNASLYGAGTLVGTDASLTMPLSVTQMRIGSVAGGAEFMNGWIKSIKYYPARAPDAQLQLLTQ